MWPLEQLSKKQKLQQPNPELSPFHESCGALYGQSTETFCNQSDELTVLRYMSKIAPRTNKLYILVSLSLALFKNVIQVLVNF